MTMYTASNTATATSQVSGARTLLRTVSSELIKLTSLRSQVWLLIVAAALVAVLGPIQTLGQVMAGPRGEAGTSAAAVSLALTGMATSTLLVGVLGVLVVTGEYAPRAIRTTFALVPRRSRVVAAKAVALALVTALVGLVSVTIAVAASLTIRSYGGDAVGWASPDALRISVLMVWYFVGWAVLGLAAGWVTRSKLGGAGLLLGVMLILTPLLGLIPGRVGELLVALTPSSVGGAMISPDHSGALTAPGVGFVLWTTYLVLFTALSSWVATRRDA
jgi:ABC-2 type transport system permease protein